ncbi:MAG TPA: hypothetical protein VFC68_04865, partial [Treponemataceae bacterium]|nr:hypothetical protein [Treponemataceae bacterium]
MTVPSFILASYLLFTTPQLEARMYTKFDGIKTSPPTWSIHESIFPHLHISCGNIVLNGAASHANAETLRLSDAKTSPASPTAGLSIGFPQTALTSPNAPAFACGFNLGTSYLVLFMQTPQKEYNTMSNSLYAAGYHLPLAFKNHTFNFAATIQNFLSKTTSTTSWYTSLPIQSAERLTALSAEMSYSSLCGKNNLYGSTTFHFYTGYSLAEQSTGNTKALFRASSKLQSPFGGLVIKGFTSDYAYTGSDSKPQIKTLLFSVQPHITIPWIDNNTTSTIDIATKNNISINMSGELYCKPPTTPDIADESTNSTLAKAMTSNHMYTSFATASIFNISNCTLLLHAHIQDISLSTYNSLVITDKTTLHAGTERTTKLINMTIHTGICANLDLQSILRALDYTCKASIQCRYGFLKAECTIQNASLTKWEIKSMLDTFPCIE